VSAISVVRHPTECIYSRNTHNSLHTFAINNSFSVAHSPARPAAIAITVIEIFSLPSLAGFVFSFISLAAPALACWVINESGHLSFRFRY
jgi:hypothetical protein